MNAPRVSLKPFLHSATLDWLGQVFDGPTPVQSQAWPEIAAGNNTLLLAPTGSGKTLAAFLIALDRLMFPRPATNAISTEAAAAAGGSEAKSRGIPPATVNKTKVLYISPLKALAVDVDRNLKSPLAGIRAVAGRQGVDFDEPTVAVRSGDTPASERARLARRPADILITTPESLYLMLTSKVRETLDSVETVIIDEIHSLVANKRGAHLFTTLERLEALRKSAGLAEHGQPPAPLQRIGLSATQRPLEEVARLLGGAEATANPAEAPRPRSVTIVEAGRRKRLDLTIEVPVEDMTRLGEVPNGAAAGPSTPSIWPSIHPRLVELIREHRSTMIFTNSRRLAERLAAAINEVAEEELALAHHGSIAKDTRTLIEDRLKRGELPAIVATSSLELGIDIGAVDLVIQIEAPPSITSGLQRVGRAGHHVGGESKGVVFPKYRGDLLACAAAASRMFEGLVEETFYPRNPLDVLAQQIVAMVALGPIPIAEVYATLRQAAPFHELSREAFENVVDLLAGRYPSDEFAGLKPRITWDRTATSGEAMPDGAPLGLLSPRKGAQRLAVLNGGTIADRGLYGVFLGDEAPPAGGEAAAENRGGRRVGELDEEMVFETRPGDVFLLGASSWRVLEITHDRVLVAPAPGEPGKMPFWRGDGPGRPAEFGRAIGQLTRQLLKLPHEKAAAQLAEESALDARAAKNLLAYLYEQAEATGAVPDDQTIVVECFLDEIGDWRVAVLSPFGARVHAPWAMAVMAQLGPERGGEVDMVWTDDGIMFRFPESDAPPDLSELFPRSEDVEDLVVKQLGGSAMFASHFRENAARALLLPKQQPGRRTPLWLQRRRAADLLQVASRFGSFPMLLETYRECLRDVFDIRNLRRLLRDTETRKIRVKQVESRTPSPFAASLMFNFIGNFLYDGDVPLAERRAASLTLDYAQLRELLGDAEIRELIDATAIDEMQLELQRKVYPLRDIDDLADLFRVVGDLSRDEVRQREQSQREQSQREQSDQTGGVDVWIDELIRQRRILPLMVAGESRLAAVEDAARFRDALGVVLPPGLADAYLESVEDPLGDLVSRYARTHTPFQVADVAGRLGLGVHVVEVALRRLVDQGRVVVGEFLPGGSGIEYCDAEVLRRLKRRSLAKLREQIEPVEAEALGRFFVQWQGLEQPRRGLDGLLDVIEQLQGARLPASDWEQQILPARIPGYRPADLDELCAAGEIVWQGDNDLARGDGRIALYLTDHFARLAPLPEPLDGDLQTQIRELLGQQGALFFTDIERQIGGFGAELLDAVWDLVWNGEVTNDTLTPMRSLRRKQVSSKRSRRRSGFRSRRQTKKPGAEGRWSLLARHQSQVTPTERHAATAAQLLQRYGIVTRALVSSEGLRGGFSGLYPVLKAMESSGAARRGYFVAAQGAAQFALPGADDRLRDPQREDQAPAPIVLAACDPANPYGTALRWPDYRGRGPRPGRIAGTRVILWEGRLLGFLNRKGDHLVSMLSVDEPERTTEARQLAAALENLASGSHATSAPVFLEQIDNEPAANSMLAPLLAERGFVAARGTLLRRTS